MREIKKKKSQTSLEDSILIYGKHAVFGALKNPNRIIEEIYLSEKNQNFEKQLEVYKNKSNKNFLIKEMKKNFIKQNFSTTIKHQGIIAKCKKLELKDYFDFLKDLKEKKRSLGVIIDGITDPNNVGAIYRSSHAFRADFILSERRNTPYENNTILNSSCGAFDMLTTFKTNNLNQAIKNFKKSS
mgnify:FL=1